jgi:hypothetical protein
MNTNSAYQNGSWIYKGDAFESFLEEKGLACKLRRGPEGEPFGNKIVEYADANIGVQVTSDRGTSSVSIADMTTQSTHWYHVPLIRDLLLGIGEHVLSLSEQIGIVTANWQAIVACFGSEQREDTHRRLSHLEWERAKRLFPQSKQYFEEQERRQQEELKAKGTGTHPNP